MYDPYGAVTVLEADGTTPTTYESAYGWQYLHQGGRLDAVTGWYGFRNRDYIPDEGRWAERDPLGLAAGDLNEYRDVGNDPTGDVDPTGLFQWPSWVLGTSGDWLDRNFGGGKYSSPRLQMQSRSGCR